MVIITRELRTCTYNFPHGSDVYQNLNDITDVHAHHIQPMSESNEGIEPGTRAIVVEPNGQEEWEFVYIDSDERMWMKVED